MLHKNILDSEHSSCNSMATFFFSLQLGVLALSFHHATKMERN